MTIDEMNQKRRELGYSYKQIAQLSGLPVSTVQKVLGGITKMPRFETLRALGAVFTQLNDDSEKIPKRNTPSSYYKNSSGAVYAACFSDNLAEYGTHSRDNNDCRDIPAGNGYIYESTARKLDEQDNEKKTFVRKKQGEYTIEDYYSLPDDKRVELIDGVIYDMGAPTGVHQLIAGEIYFAFSSFIKRNRGRCIPFISPLDVQLDMDEKTMVQPDVIVLCDRKKNTVKNIYGAPDLAVEVLSPSSAKRDMSIKLKKYRDAGVREYWIVDPDIEQVIAYRFKEKMEVTIYDSQAKIPVWIFNNEFSVDFKEIFEYVRFAFEEAEPADEEEY